MASIITHPLVPLVAATVVGTGLVSWRLILLGILFAIAPDFDVIAFRLDIPYESEWGHRGFTHSIAFAFFCAAVIIPFAPLLKASQPVVFLYLWICMASHGVMDALTNAGLGVAFFWPFSQERIFFPVRPVDASPVSIRRFLDGRGLEILQTEIVWLWFPLAVFGMTAFVLRKFVMARVLSRSISQGISRAEN
jgi:inner membrane protein